MAIPMDPMNNSEFTAKNNPQERAMEVMREQDFPKEEIEILKKHDRPFDPITQFCVLLRLRYAESESVLWANHSERELKQLESQRSILESCEKMALPRTVTERMEYWMTRGYTTLFLYSKDTRTRHGRFTDMATIQRSEVRIVDPRQDPRNQENSLLDQAVEGTGLKQTPFGVIPNSVRGALGGVRRNRG